MNKIKRWLENCWRSLRHKLSLYGYTNFSGVLHPLKICSKCSYICKYIVFHGSRNWSLSVCIFILLFCFKLILNAFTWLKAAMNRRFVTCFCDVAIHIIAVSRMINSSNHNAFMVKKYRKWSFWKLSNRFWWCNIVLSRRPRCTCTKPNTVLRPFWIVLT